MKCAPNLRDLQHWMKWIITDPRGVQDAISDPRPIMQEHQDRYWAPTESQIQWIENSKIAAIERLNVYAEGYFFRIVECLEKDFPRVKLAVGDELFSQIVSQYLKVFPSQFTSIDEVGFRFADFISTWENLPFTWISDLALFEWSLIEAFYAHEPAFDKDWFHKLASSEDDNLRLRVHPSVRLLESKWSLPKILDQLGSNTPFNFQSTAQENSHILIYRHDDFHCWEVVEAPYFEILKKIKSGFTLDEATAHLEEKHAARLSSVFSHWVQRTVLIGVSEEPTL